MKRILSFIVIFLLLSSILPTFVPNARAAQVADPYFSPTPGTYLSSVSVSISCDTWFATIHYTTDGSTPTTLSPTYNGAILVTSTTSFRARAFLFGYTDSNVVPATYTIVKTVSVTFSATGLGWTSGTVLTVQGSPVSVPYTGTYTVGQSVSFVWYTPVADYVYSTTRYEWWRTSGLSTVRSGSFTVPVGGGTVVADYATSYQVSFAVSPAGSGSTSPSGTVWLRSGANYIAATPASGYSFQSWSGPWPTITFDSSTTTPTYATINGAGTITANFIVTPKVAAPTFSPTPSTYTGSVSVSMSCATSGATIHYTTDGTTPTLSSPTYSSPVTVTTTTTFYAKAFRSGYIDSDVSPATYTIVASITFSANGLGATTSGTTLTVDGQSYLFSYFSNSHTFTWVVGSSHSFSWSTTYDSTYSTEEYQWSSSSGLSTLKQGSVTVPSSGGSITASYSTYFWVAVVSSSTSLGTIVTPMTGNWYISGSVVPIQAQVIGYNQFTGWTTSCNSPLIGSIPIGNSGSLSTTMTVNGGGTVTANFQGPPSVLVTFAANTIGAYVGTALTVNGVSQSVPYTASFLAGSQVSFAWSSQVYAGSGTTRYEWWRTSGLSNLQSGSFTVPVGGGSVVADYATAHQVTFAVSPAGSGSTSPSGTVWLRSGANYITATAAPGYTFQSWSGPWPTITFDSTTATPTYATINGPGTITANFIVTPKVAAPSFSPMAGTYTGSVPVTMSCGTSGAVIHYTTDGTTPTLSSPTYSSPITVTTTTTFYAKAFKSGYTDSDVSPATYTIVYNVAFSANGLGLLTSGTVLTVDGVVRSVPYAATFAAGQSVSYEWHTPVSDMVSTTRYEWRRTSGLSSLRAGVITVPIGGGIVTADYDTCYQVNFAVSPTDGGSTSPSTTQWCKAGSNLPIVASSIPSYDFLKWSTSIISPISIASTTSSSTTATINGADTITASFVKIAGIGDIQRPNKAFYSDQDVQSQVSIQNTGTGTHSYIVQFTIIGPFDVNGNPLNQYSTSSIVFSYDGSIGGTGTLTQFISAGDTGTATMKWTVPRTAYAGSYSLQVDVYTYDPILQQVGVYLASKSELYLFSVVQDYSYAETYTFAFGAKGIHVHVSQADMNSPVVNGFTTSDYEFWSTILEAAQLAVGQVTPETPITWLNVIGHVMDLNDAYLTGQDFANLVYKTDDGADFLVLQFLQGNTAFFYKGDFVWLKNVYHWPDPGVIIPFNPDTVTVPGYWIWNIDAYTVVVRSGANGQISPGTGTVVFGSTPVYTITPDTGYHIASITVDGGPVLVTSPKGQTYQFSPITYASSISATFAIDTFTITVSYGSGGSITPGTGSVNYGATPTYTITPNSGDHIASITVNGAPVTVTNPKGQTYTFAPVTSAGSVSATFAVDTFVITVSAGVNGQISPGTGSVNYGATPTYSVTPNVGYHIVSITVNGGSVAVTSPKGQSYQFAPVTSAGSIAATFAVDTVGKIAGVVSDLTYTGIAGATVSYVGPVSDSVSTDGSGNYVTPDLSPGSYTVTVSKAWYVSQTKPATVSSGSTTTLNFYLQNAGSFNGRVIDSVTGNGISGADVSYSGSSAGSTSSDADGYYTASNLPTGSYSIIASKTGYTPQTKSATVIIGSSVTVDFQLQPIVNPGSITGRVTDSLTNDGVEGASVAASGPGSGSAITDSNGYYTITSLPSGSSYTVTASKTGYTPQTKTASVTSGSSTTLDFQLQPISPPLFADGFESGGFSAWTGSSNSAGETGAIVGSPTHHGTYSAKFTSNGNGGTESAYCYESVQSSAELFARGYFYLSQSGIVEESDRFFFIILKAGSNGVAYAGWKKTGGLVEWCLVVRSGASYVYAYSADVPSLNRWYCVELHWKEDAVAGSGDLWVDGSLVCSLTGRNTGSYGDANQVGLGLPQISDCASTTIYSDCVVVARANIGPEPPTPISPYVSSHAPEADATNVAVTSNIQVTFSEPMDQTSTQNAFTISPSVSGSFSWSSGDTVMTFTPTSNLAYETLYMVTIASSAQDKEGQNMLSSSSWSFTTGTNGLAQGTFGKIDIGASVSNLCTYSYGSRYQITENGAAQSLSLYVQEATGSGTALKVAIYSDNAGIPVTLLAQGTMTVPANYQGWITVALTSKPVLSAGGYYWLVADAKVSGKTLRFYYSTGTTNQGVYGTTSYASFPANPCQYSARNARAYGIYCTYLTTAPSAPTVVNHVPSSDATGVSTSTSVQVTFSEPMDQTSSQNAFTISPSVSGNFTWTVSDTVMTFTPNASLAQGTLYTISISAAAQSKTPKSLVPCSWSFQTANAGITETFGKTDVGASQTNLCQYFYGSRYQVSKDGVAQSISIRVSEANGEARTVKVAIYSDVGGAPGNLLASGTGTVPAGTDGWVTIALTTAPNLSAGAYYWLVVDATASGKTLRFYYSTGSTNQAIYGTTSLASFPINPCSYAGFKARAYSIYCTYLTNPPSAPSGTSDIPASDATSVSTTTFITVILSEPIDRHTRRRVK